MFLYFPYWMLKAILLIGEICVANESEGGGVIVVLADANRDQWVACHAVQ